MIGLGAVGEWVLRALHAGAGPLAARYGVRFSVVGVASARHAVVCQASPVGEITIIGPGAGL